MFNSYGSTIGLTVGSCGLNFVSATHESAFFVDVITGSVELMAFKNPVD